MITPLYDRVLVRPIIEKSSIFDEPTEKKEGFQKAEVVSTGDYNPETHLPLKVKPGDIVWFNKFQGIPIDSSGEQLLLIREKNIEVIL